MGGRGATINENEGGGRRAMKWKLKSEPRIFSAIILIRKRVAPVVSAGVFDGGNALDDLTVCALTPCFQQGMLNH